MSMILGKKAKIIIGDYYYVFSEKVRNSFFKRLNKDLEDCIIIVDEGHNLPERIRELLTGRLTANMIQRAILAP